MSDKNQVKSERCRKEKKFFFPLYVTIIPASWRSEWFLLSAAVFGWNCPAKSRSVVLSAFY